MKSPPIKILVSFVPGAIVIKFAFTVNELNIPELGVILPIDPFTLPEIPPLKFIDEVNVLTPDIL